MRHILDRDDPSSAIPAALIASIAFVHYPDTTVALYVMWKMLQVSDSVDTSISQQQKYSISIRFDSFRTTQAVMLATCPRYRSSQYFCIARARPHYSMQRFSNPPICARATGNFCIHSREDGKSHSATYIPHILFYLI